MTRRLPKSKGYKKLQASDKDDVPVKGARSAKASTDVVGEEDQVVRPDQTSELGSF